jgi:hypothetical protein
MASPIHISVPHVPVALTVTVERLVIVGLVALATIGVFASIVLGPAVIIPVLLAGLLALGIEQLERRAEAKQAAERAAAAGVHGSITVWGKVVNVFGECPTGGTPRKGQSFVVASGQIWPELCVHAQTAILTEVERMERNHDIDAEPVHFHDADHQIDLELYRAPAHLKAA